MPTLVSLLSSGALLPRTGRFTRWLSLTGTQQDVLAFVMVAVNVSLAFVGFLLTRGNV